MRNFVATSRKKFWVKNGPIMIGGAFFCVLLDALSFLAFAIYIPSIEVFTAGTMALAQIFISIGFVSVTTSFLKTTYANLGFIGSNTMDAGELNRSMQTNRIIKSTRRLAKLLLASSILTLFLVGFIIAAALSGRKSTFYGLHSPVGWCVQWSFSLFLRWAVSFCQIQMSTPFVRKKRKSRRKNKGSLSSQKEARSSSTVGSTNGSEIHTSNISGTYSSDSE